MLYPTKPPKDQRDAEEHAAIAAVLEALPLEHPARRAYAEGADTIKLGHLVGRPDLADRLTQAYVDGYRRFLERAGRHFRP